MNDTQSIPLKHPDRLYINGQWLPPAEGGQLDIHAPHLSRAVQSVAAAGNRDMDAAVKAARAAFDQGPWPRLSPEERAAYLRRLHEALSDRTDDLSRSLVLQTGTVASGAPMMTGLGLHMLDFFAKGADGFRFVEAHPAADGQGPAMVTYDPVGVAVTIAPWNAPFTIMMNKIAPALLAGCCVIMKPAPETPLEAFIIAEAAEAAGFPPGVLNLVPADREAADHLVCNPGVDKVSFTGSVTAGKRIAAVCGSRVARCTLELGGKSAAIVLDDYPLEEAARTLAGIITIACGQVCVTLSRVIVSRSRHDALVNLLREQLEQVKVGNPEAPDTQMGPLAMMRQLERVERCIRKGIAEGATLVCGGSRPAGHKGPYIQPTLFANVDNRSSIAREEIFGPVLCVIPCEDEADAIRIANDSPYGLYGMVMTHDNEAAWRVARQVRSGAFAQNQFRLDYFLPFGGLKESGMGREGGITGLKGYLESRTLLMDAMPGE